MARGKPAVNAHKKRRVILERAEGYRGQRSRLYRKAKEQVTHSLVYSYNDRRTKKGRLRRPAPTARRGPASVCSGARGSTRHRARTASRTTASSRASASRASRSTV